MLSSLRTLSLRTSLWFGCLATLFCAGTSAEDWPTYRHDIRRSGITSESLRMPLAPVWVYHPQHKPAPAWEPPRSVPVEGILELPRIRFDDAYHVVTSAGLIYFGSSSDNKVYCLDARTGRMRWEFFTGGPVRLAPTIWKGKAYFGSDDGVAYCLDARTGRQVWRVAMGPRDRRLLGRGKMVSMWPIRTGVLVDKGVAYCAAGLFPQEGVYIVALDAKTGKVLWRNDTAGEAAGGSRISPQGYLLATDDLLYVPLGRVSPAAVDRASGAIRYAAYFGKNIGGVDALIFNDKLYTGTEEIMAYVGRTRGRFAWFKARKVLVTPDVTYALNGKEAAAFNRKTYPAASRRRFALRAQRQRLWYQMRGPQRTRDRIARTVNREKKRLEDINKQLAQLGAKGSPQAIDKLKTERLKLEKTLQADLKKLQKAEAALAPLLERKRKMDAEWEQAGETMEKSKEWRVPCACWASFIKAGRALIAGGDKEVVALDAATGKTLWRAEVDGRAKGLAAAEGRLFVSTDTGAIYCFGPEGAATVGPVEPTVNEHPFPSSNFSKLCQDAADSIVRLSGVRRGYALVMGFETGQLAYELAKRTDLIVYAIDPDAKKVQAARKAIDASGLYGDRVVVDQGRLDQLPYSDYFANLVVSERALARGLSGLSASEAKRVQKPRGGVILMGRPADASGLTAAALKQWLGAGTVLTRGGVWLKSVRGPLPGEDNWTCEYGNPGNTASSNDQLVKAPFGMLWFGDPGPKQMVSRHRRQAAPLAVNGVLFVQGENKVNAYDAYNGLKLWDRDFPKVVRVGVSNNCSNLAADERSFYVAWHDKCYRLDAKTGRDLAVYQTPQKPGTKRRWGYVSCDRGVLFGSGTPWGRVADILFAYDADSGKLLWKRPCRADHPTISAGDGRLFYIENTASAADRAAAMRDAGYRTAEAKQKMRSAPVRIVTALDARTGRLVWRQPKDLTGCIGGMYWSALATMYHHDVLAVFGVYTDAHHWNDFFAGHFKSRRVIALNAKNGRKLWDQRIGYRVRPVIIGDTFHAEPWAFDLRTGKQRMRVNPITGMKEPWQWTRPGHHCGAPDGCPGALFARSYYLAYYDLIHEAGVVHLGAQRTGCWINFLPACGLLLVPEASSGCMCPFPIMCTSVLKHRKENRGWGQYSTWSSDVRPVKHLAVNLGAPGDRLAPDGQLWLGFPRRAFRLVLGFKLVEQHYPGGGYFKHSTDYLKVRGTDAPWLYTFGLRGPRRIKLPLLRPGDGEALYAVRLYFADLDNNEPGRRVFDIALQGKTVARRVDIVKETGAGRKALRKEFKGIPVTEELQIDFKARSGRPAMDQAPVLQAIEVVREKVVSIGFAAPTFLLNNEKREQAGEVRITNLKDEAFDGYLVVDAPRGFSIEPRRARIKVAPGERRVVALRAKVLRTGRPRTYAVPLKLVRRNGKVEYEQKTKLEYLADRGRIVLKAVADAYVGRNGDNGTGRVLYVDGGNRKMGDESHQIAYLRFKLNVPGKPLSAVFRIYNAGNPTSNGGDVCLVTEPWSEKSIHYTKRPQPGKVLGNLGRVKENQVLELPLKNLSLAGRKELSLAIAPKNCDGVNYFSREGGKPAELVVEYSLK